jgi:hypothetical protein
MKMKVFLTVSLLAWLLVLFGYIHWSVRTASAGETPLWETQDRATATRRLKESSIAGWTKIAAEAIRYGALVNDTDEYGTTPLILAAIRGHERIVKLLLDGGADPNHENDDHVSAMIGAAANCNDPVVTLLLRRGANPNVKSQTRQTPLMRAAENGCAVVVRELLKVKGIDLRATDDSGHTALDYARDSSVLGLDNGDSFALIDGLRRDAVAKATRPPVIRHPVGLPRGTRVPPLPPRAIPVFD